MPRKATGSVFESRGVWYAKVTLGPKRRPTVALPNATRAEEALERASLIADAVRRLRRVGRSDVFDALLDQLASATGVRLIALLKVIDGLVEGREEKEIAAPLEVGATFGELAARWISGDLHRAYPGHVRAADHEKNQNAARLRKYVLPIVADVPLKSFTLDHAEEVMRRPPERSRRHVAAVLMRVLALAVYPARIISVSPTPRGWLPKPMNVRAGTYLYPDEDAALLACARVPLMMRVLFGFLAREGMRASEAANLLWADVDLTRGSVRLDVNKTDDPRMWALDPGVLEGLRAWLEIAPAAPYVFPGEHGGAIQIRHLSVQLRRSLQHAGLARPALFVGNKNRMRLRAHDLRATFITLSLASGQTEQWVMDRTGHKSSLMIQRYRRAARTAAELGLGTLRPLVEAVPELARESSAIVHTEPRSEDGKDGAMQTTENKAVRRAGLEPACLSALEPKASPSASIRRDPSPSPTDPDLGCDGSLPFGDDSDASRTFRTLGTSPLGRASLRAVAAAKSGDPEALRTALEGVAEEHAATLAASSDHDDDGRPSGGAS